MGGELKTKAIVLASTEYKEQDRIVTLFSPEHGRIDAKARACRKAASPLLACTQLFACGEYVLFRRQDKAVITQCDGIESFYPLREDVERFSAAAFASALCRASVQEEEGNAALFTLFYRVCSYLAYGETGIREMMTGFVTHFLALTGFQPAITHCAVCAKDLRAASSIRFSAELGGAVCPSCGLFADKTTPLALEVIRRVTLMDEEDFPKIVLKEELSRAVLSLLTDYACYCVPGARKAGEAMRELLL